MCGILHTKVAVPALDYHIPQLKILEDRLEWVVNKKLPAKSPDLL